MNPEGKDNAAMRSSYVSQIYQTGVKNAKLNVLNELDEEYVKLHENGYIHIHDLESFGKVYNCCMPKIDNIFYTDDSSQNLSQYAIILDLFEKYKSLITNLGTCQSGGIGFANFDIDIGEYLEKHNIKKDKINIVLLKDSIHLFIKWINLTCTRYCREPYYLTFNLGLGTSFWARKVTTFFLKEFEESPIVYTRPNIVFKVNKKINSLDGTPNYDLLQMALRCTSKRMIPTYLLTNSLPNKLCDPFKIGIMGCRTRVYQNINGEETSIGRGNLAYVSLNLPGIALTTDSIKGFFEKLMDIMKSSATLLNKRAVLTKLNSDEYLKYINEKQLWINPNGSIDFLKQGTLSIGFIGLSEAVEVLTDNKFYNNSDSFQLAIEIITKMRDFIDALREEEKMNFTLMATPGEMLSGRFCDIDKIKHKHRIHEKGFYTNSFHVDVNSGLSLFDKIDREAPFHSLCNGGCITYIEFKSAPLNNVLALMDAIRYAEIKGISYLGFNYPLDICNNCGKTGTFDTCDQCNSEDIKRIRRVSGYLEDLNYFTKGKEAEVRKRIANI